MPSSLAVTRCAPAELYGIGARLRASAEPRVAIVVIEGDALLLGRWQHAPTALRLDAVAGRGIPVARRLTGGRTLRLRGRTVAVLLALPSLEGLEPARALGRHVRGLRAALAALTHAPVAYFGRDHLVGGGGALAWVGQEGTATGATVIEAILGAEAPEPELVRYPAHGDPRVQGVAFVPYVPDALALAARLVPDATPASLERAASPPSEDDAGYVASGVADVPIGFAMALARHDGARVVAARLRGDFQAPEHGVAALEGALAGTALDAGPLRAAIARALGGAGFFLHGIVDAGILADAVLETRDEALAALAAKYRTLAALRARREEAEAAGRTIFDEAESAGRRAAFRDIARAFPGALRELEALSAARLAARADEVDAERGTGLPVADGWIRVALDFHQTLAATLAAKMWLARRVGNGVLSEEVAAEHELGWARLTAVRRPPRGRLIDLVWAEVGERQRRSRAEMERMITG
jgi:hypothetical protein